MKKLRSPQLEEEEDSELEPDYILDIFPHGKKFSTFLEMSDNDAKLALSVWAEQLELVIEKIHDLLSKFEDNELNISCTGDNFVCVEGDEKLLEEAVEDELLHNDKYVLGAKDIDEDIFADCFIDNDEY